MRHVRSALPRFWRRTDWGRQTRDSQTKRKRARRDTSYISALEISPRGMVHMHVLVYGEYVAQRELERAWSQALGERARVDVRAVAGPNGVADAIREVLKYATKGEKGVRTQAERAAAVELALRNVKRVMLGGVIRRVKVTNVDSASVDVSERDLLKERALSCEVCGVVGEWEWAGRRSPELVTQNGGFGLLRSCPVNLETGNHDRQTRTTPASHCPAHRIRSPRTPLVARTSRRDHGPDHRGRVWGARGRPERSDYPRGPA